MQAQARAKQLLSRSQQKICFLGANSDFHPEASLLCLLKCLNSPDAYLPASGHGAHAGCTLRMACKLSAQILHLHALIFVYSFASMAAPDDQDYSRWQASFNRRTLRTLFLPGKRTGQASQILEAASAGPLAGCRHA